MPILRQRQAGARGSTQELFGVWAGMSQELMGRVAYGNRQELFGVGDRSYSEFVWGRALVPVFYAAPKVSVGNPYWP